MKRRDPLPAFSIDRASHDAIHRQLAAVLRHAIYAGALPPGAALPSTRAMASSLGISRNTVITAYEELTAEGLLMARAGSATRVVPLLRREPGAARYSTFRASGANELYCQR